MTHTFQSRAPQCGHAAGKSWCGGWRNSVSQRWQWNASGVMRRNASTVIPIPTIAGMHMNSSASTTSTIET